MGRTAAASLLLLCLVAPAAVSIAQTATPPPLNLILSGPGTTPNTGGGYIGVDDDLFVTLDGVLIYSDGSALSGQRAPINFKGSPGQKLHFSVQDTYGFCSGLSQVYLSCKGSSVYTLADPGFDLGCGRGSGDHGIVHNADFTIPATLPGCSSTSIGAIEFTQAIQQFQTLDDLKASLASSSEPPVPMISNKLAVMRIYFSQVTDASTVTLNVTGQVSGSQTLALQPGCAPKDARTHNNGCPSMDFYFIPPSGKWSVDLVLNDSNGNQLQHETLNLKSRDTKSINLNAVQLCDTNAFNPQCGDPTVLLSKVGPLQAMAPTGVVNVAVTPYKFASDLNHTPITPPGRNYNWELGLVTQVAALYGVSDYLADSSGNSYTTYFGIYPGNVDGSGLTASIPGHGALNGDVTTFLGIDDSAPGDAHETLHSIGLRHTNLSVTTSKTIPGCYGAASDSNSTWPYASNRVQSSNGYEYGFDVAKHQVQQDPTFDIMSYCIPQWISPFQYKLAIYDLNGGSVTSPSIAPPVATPYSATSATPEAARPNALPVAAAGNYWEIGGTIAATGTTLDPVFTQKIIGSTDPGTGSYAIKVLSGSSAVLYTRYFDPVSAVSDNVDGTTYFSSPYFHQWIPVTPGAASIIVVDNNGNTLSTVALSGTAPTVTFTSPASGFTGTGQQPVSWTINSPTATSFTSRLLFSSNGGTTWSQIAQTTSNSTTVDFTYLPGTANGLFQLIATDGVNSGSATSIPFTVSKHKPSTVVINTPLTGAVQRASDPVYLSGAVYDADDGVLSGTALKWSSDVQGALGTGSPLITSLKAGTHTLTLTGTDSDGNSISATTKITLGGAGPVLSLTTNSLSANCTNATINAAPGSLGAPLSSVNYSLDGGTTYTSIPSASLPYSFIVPTSGAVNLVATAYDASGQSAAQNAELNIPGICVVESVIGTSGNTQTAPIGSTFSQPLTVKVAGPSGAGIPGVTVTFTVPASGPTATLSALSGLTGADGTFSVTGTANGTIGNYVITAAASGTTSTTTFNLANNDFQISAPNPVLTITHGSSGKLNLSLASLGGFTGTVNLACTGLPTGVTCSFAPSTISLQPGSFGTVLTVSVPSNAVAMNKPMSATGIALAGCGCLLLLFRRRRRVRLLLIACIATASFVSLSGCGSNFKSFNTSFQVTATSGSTIRSSTVTLNVN